MQMQQAGKVASTPTPKIAQGPTPVQIKPTPEIQIQQKPQTEAEKFKQAAKMAALNAGMNNAFQAGATTAAMTNPMAAPLALASMFLKEGDKVPDYEQKTFRGQPIDWSNPWEYVGMDKMTAAEIFKEESPSSGFSTKFARKKGGQDFSTEGPGVGYDTYIPELDMNNWQKYGYDYGRIREMFLDNPYNRTSENYQAFLWSHMTPAQRLKAMQEGGVLSNWAIQDYLETGKDKSWKRYVPQDVSYYSKGNKVKKPGYYAEGDQIPDQLLMTVPEESNTVKPPLGNLTALNFLRNLMMSGRGQGIIGPLFGAKGKLPLVLDNKKMNMSNSPWESSAARSANNQLKNIINEAKPSPFMKHFESLIFNMSEKEQKRFWANWDKLGAEGQMNFMNAREAEFNRELRNKKLNELNKQNVKNLKTELAVREELKNMSNPEAKLYTADGKPVKGSDLMSKDLENYTSKWNQFKRGLAKFAAPLTGPFAGPLGAAATLLDTQPLNVDETPEAVQKARELQAAAYKDGPIISEEDQEYLMRKAFIEENNPQPVYKEHGGGTFDLEKVLNYIPVQYKPTAFNQARPFMDQPYFQNVDSGSDNNPSFTDQVMGGNVNLWGPLSLDWNHGFGGQVGVGMDVPIMGGRPQWQ